MMPFRSFLLSYLLNAVWQVPLLYAGGVLLARITRQARPILHFRLWSAVLVLQVLVPASTLIPRSFLQTFQQWFTPNQASASGQVSTFLAGVQLHTGYALPSTVWIPLLLAYSAVILYFLARLILGVWQVHRLAQSAKPLSPSHPIHAEWQAAQAQCGIRGALLAQSPRAAGLMTIGFRHKLVLAPPSTLEALAPGDRFAAFAHECAHMQRNDFTWNFLLQCLMLPVAFHPFAYRCLTRIAEHREMICDDLAASVSNGRQTYAKSLLRLATAFVPATAAPTLHAIGMLDAHTLERRLMRLKTNSSPLRRPQILAMAATALVVLSGTWATASALHVGIGAPAPQTQEPSRQALHVEGGTMAGHVQNRVNPVYPQAAKEAGISGTVVLKAIIDENGQIQNLSVLSGPEELQNSAIDAVKQWSYEPYMLNGQPVSVETTITVNYQLNP